jgi:hypothetical protein
MKSTRSNDFPKVSLAPPASRPRLSLVTRHSSLLQHSSLLRHLSLLFLLWAIAGCEKKPEAPAGSNLNQAGVGSKATANETVSLTAPKPAAVLVEKTSFTEVTSRLDQGGTLFGYLGTAQWCEGLANTVDDWRNFALGLPNLGPQERAAITNGFALATPLIRKSGLESLTGVGISGIAIGNGLYRTRIVSHHYPGKGSGFLWNAMGSASHPLTSVNMLPADTALAAFGDLDLGSVWTGVEETADQSGVAAAGEALRGFASTFEKYTGLAWKPLIASLGTEYGFFLTMDSERKITLPFPPTPMTLPEPGLVIVLRVKNDLLFDRLDLLLKQNPMTTNMDKPGLKMRVMPLPIPLPITLRPTIARSGDFLYLASTDDLLLRVLDVQAGKKPGLKGTEAFKRLSQGIPLEGNQFSYISKRFGEVLTQVQTSALQAGGPNGAIRLELMQKLTGPMGTAESIAVARIDAEGWSMVSIGTKEPASAVIIPALVVPVSVASALALPALAKAKQRAMSMSCVNNLKQIGLAARMWADDNKGVYPSDFLTLTNYLGSPFVLICPSAKNGGSAISLTWQNLSPSDITYQWLAAGAKDDPAKAGEVLARCPIHGHVVLRDGSVRQGNGP